MFVEEREKEVDHMAAVFLCNAKSRAPHCCKMRLRNFG